MVKIVIRTLFITSWIVSLRSWSFIHDWFIPLNKSDKNPDENCWINLVLKRTFDIAHMETVLPAFWNQTKTTSTAWYWWPVRWIEESDKPIKATIYIDNKALRKYWTNATRHILGVQQMRSVCAGFLQTVMG